MRVDRSFVLLDAHQLVAQAVEALDAHAGAHYAIVRRERAGSIYWYSYPRTEALDRLAQRAPGETLEDALNLHEYTASPLHHEANPDPTTFVPGAVVLNPRGRLIGVLEREYLAGPPAAAPSPAPSPSQPSWPADESRHSRSRGWTWWIPKMEPSEPPTRGRRRGGLTAAPPHAAPPPPAAAPPPSPGPAGRGGGAGAGSGEGAAVTGPLALPTERQPFAAWPELKAPPQVEELWDFELEVGFAAARQAGTAGGPVVIVNAPPDFDLRVQVVAVGFQAPGGWTHDLHVVRDNPYVARLKVGLVADANERPVETRTISVLYYYESNLCGQAQRSIVVTNSSAPAADRAAAVASAPAPAAVPLRVRTGLRAPDLTVAIRLGSGRGQRETFEWSFESPHAVAISDGTAVTELDRDAASYVDAVLADLVGLAGGALGDNQVRGIARRIEAKVPAAFWIALKQVAGAIAQEGRVPDVLFVSEETRLPWELAWMREPLDPTRCEHLGAQVNIGRWILGAARAPLPPEDCVPWRRMVVVVGNYPASSGAALPDAVLEARDLAARYASNAAPLEMSGAALDPLLEAEQPEDGCELVHFACHGRAKTADPSGSALMMQDGSRLTPEVIGGSELGGKWQPFLFLNACEVGRAGQALGETAGFAGNALAEGFRGFVGPLWEVDSKKAHEVAMEFYKRTLDDGMPVGAALRELRASYRYGGANAPASADTYLAYVYYGHPALRLERQP